MGHEAGIAPTYPTVFNDVPLEYCLVANHDFSFGSVNDFLLIMNGLTIHLGERLCLAQGNGLAWKNNRESGRCSRCCVQGDSVIHLSDPS